VSVSFFVAVFRFILAGRRLIDRILMDTCPSSTSCATSLHQLWNTFFNDFRRHPL
jgi:hypothetical protein